MANRVEHRRERGGVDPFVAAFAALSVGYFVSQMVVEQLSSPACQEWNSSMEQARRATQIARERFDYVGEVFYEELQSIRKEEKCSNLSYRKITHRSGEVEVRVSCRGKPVQDGRLSDLAKEEKLARDAWVQSVKKQWYIERQQPILCKDRKR